MNTNQSLVNKAYLHTITYLSIVEANKIDGLIIFDIDDDEMITLLSIKNSIHRKRLRKGNPPHKILHLSNYYSNEAIQILNQYQKEYCGQQKDVAAKSMMSESGLDITGFNHSK